MTLVIRGCQEQRETKLSNYILDNVKDLTELINENSEIIFDPN